MRTKLAVTCALATLLASITYAQPTPTRVPPKFTVATAPSCVDGEPRIYSVTDAASSASCEIAASPGVEVFCQCLDGVRSVLTSAGGSGTVTSVALAVPAEWTVSGSPVTTSGTITISEATQTANTVYAGPTTGAAAAPGFRTLVSADVPNNAADTSGNAATATALAANPADCAANQFANAIAASGALTCAAISDADVPDGITVTLAGTATALAANGANCSAGNYPLGVDASGAAESCTADDDTPDSDSEVPDAITVTGSVAPSTFTFPASATPAQTTDAQAAWDSDDNRLTVGDGAATAIIYPGAHAGAATDGGAATTATALAANGANCSAGNYPLGVDASGAVESCTAISGGIGGSTGATDNQVLVADGVGGATLISAPLVINDTTGNIQGPSGGFSITGGTAASNNLTLVSTSSATKGMIVAGAANAGETVLVGQLDLNHAGSNYARIKATGTGIDFLASNSGTNKANIQPADVYMFDGANQVAALYNSNNTWAMSSDFALGWSASTTTWNPIDTGLARNAAGVVRVTNGSTGTRGLLGGGAAVASATALPVPTGRVFHVTGTTTVTSITSTNFGSGACVTLIFDDILTVTDGSNLKLAGDFVTTADDTISLCYDGTNWFETGRSVN